MYNNIKIKNINKNYIFNDLININDVRYIYFKCNYKKNNLKKSLFYFIK